MGKAIIIEQVEIWKEISGYEGYYKVSNLGRILSIRSNKIMSPEVTRKGYLRVTFSCNGKSSRYLIHVLVAREFIGISKLQVNHKDLNKSNNYLENLEYVTPRMNKHHYIVNTNKELPIGVRKMKSKFQARLNIGKDTLYLGVFDTPQLASNAYKKALESL